jgi:hypothetical protein
MVDQAQVNNPGSAAAAARDGARSTADFLHDLLTLAELSWQLLALDSRQFARRLIWPAIGLACGAALGVSCLPLALVVLALALEETTTLSLAQSFGAALGVGVGVATSLVCGVIWFVRRRLTFLERSKGQWHHNVRWLKETLERLKHIRT